MENISLVRKCLGGKIAIGTPKTELDFVPIIRRGFPAAAFTAIREWTNLSDESIYRALRIAKRTGARRLAQGDRLKPAESELLLRLARVMANAQDILGDKQKARQWLSTENRALGGVTPISLLDTGIGFQQVLDALNRIEYGVFS